MRDEKASQSLSSREAGAATGNTMLSPVPLRIGSMRSRLARWMLQVAEVADRRPAVAFLILLLIAVPAILGHSVNRALWHDELFTFYISQQPTVSGMLRANSLIDLVPPLSFLLTRASYAAFGVNTLSTRLPEMAGFLLAMAALFAFVRRRAGTLYGLAAATLFYTGSAAQFATEARPYGLLLGFGALGLLAWQKAREHSRFAVPLLLLSSFGMLLDHVFSAYIWTALALAEGARILQRRQIEWKLVLAWALPLVSVVTWAPLLRTHGGDIYPQAFRPELNSIPAFYYSWTQQVTTFVLFSAAGLFVLAGRKALRGGGSWALTMPEWVAVLGLLSVPVIVIVQLMRSHAAFFPRYGVPASLAISIVAALLLSFWTRGDRRAALLCVLAALSLSHELHFAAGAVLHRHLLTTTEPVNEPCEPCMLTARLDPYLPLVDASGIAFVEMNNRESTETLARVYYLTDPAASTQYAHANIFEGMALEKQILGLRGNVSPYSAFTTAHRRFFVFGDYAYAEDWLLKKLKADGATLEFLGPVKSSYTSHDLYEVTLAGGQPTQ